MASRCSQCGSFPTGFPMSSRTLAEELLASEPFDLNTAVAYSPGRHKQLMKTNEPPEEPELPYIRSVIAETTTRMTRLEDEITRLKSKLKQMEEEHAALSAYLTQNTSILSPLRQMPPEVLGEIFSWVAPSIGEAVRGSLAIEASPWVLTHVSSRWRSISLSTPSLWSLVAVDCASEFVYPLTMLRTQIERARKLEVHFFGHQKRDPRPQIETFKLLTEHSSLWEILSLQLTSHLLPLMAALQDRVPLLREAWVQWDASESQTSSDFFTCFRSANSLVDLGISDQICITVAPTILPMHQLTRYDLDAPWNTHREILKLTLNLVEARINIAFDDGVSWPAPSEFIQLLHLRRLYVSDVEVLDYIRATTLEGIALYIGSGENHHTFLHLEPFLVASSCPLQTLCVTGTPDPHSTLTIVNKYPSITKLRIVMTPLDQDGDEDAVRAMADSFLTHLIVPNPPDTRQSIFSPQLTEICFACQVPNYLNYPLYLKMLQSRSTAKGGALKAAVAAVLTETDSGPDLETRSGFDALRQGGMSILVLDNAEAAVDRWAYTKGMNVANSTDLTLHL
ncbi:hypothetical protein B0H11DRAFT_2276233 [Mycena galericulata]|nr:hypothetical protein B0H11DRAFT_2276233 [Mycena galericulata]